MQYTVIDELLDYKESNVFPNNKRQNPPIDLDILSDEDEPINSEKYAT